MATANEARFVAAVSGIDTGSNHALAELLGSMDLYLDLQDPDGVITVLAASVVAAIDEGEPCWLMIVAPPSWGKGEAIKTIEPVVDYATKDLTLAGMLTVSQKGKGIGMPRGLLTKYEGRRDVLMTITDFSAMLGDPKSSGGTKTELFNALRDIYDGHYVRTMNNGAAEWTGKITFIAACTSAIDRFSSHSDSLGPRWIYLRMEARDEVSKRRMTAVVGERQSLAAHRSNAQRQVPAVIEKARHRIATDQVDVPEKLTALLTECAMLIAYGRAAVPRDYRNEICDVTEVEEPGRVMHQLRLLAIGLRALELPGPVIGRILRRVAVGTIPKRRADILRFVAANPGASGRAIADATDINRRVVKVGLEDWEAIGVLENGTDEDAQKLGMPSTWSLREEHRQMVEACFA